MESKIFSFFCVWLSFVVNAKADTRIVNGVREPIKNIPYQVAILKEGGFMCGGALLRNNWVLTAAHCLTTETAPQLSIRYGSERYDAGGGTSQVRRIVRHPKYQESTDNNDIALLQLNSPIKFTSTAKAIAIASKQPSNGAMLKVSGWGYTSYGGNLSNFLLSVRLPYISTDVCKSRYYGSEITNNMFCAGYASGGKDACQGDSGGPIVYNGYLVGIVSWGRGCGGTNAPGVYTKATNYIKWVNEMINK